MPNLFLIGAPKCGTTSLAAWLASHPDIYFCPRKDPHWFCDDIHSDMGVASAGEYLALFDAATTQPWRAEGSVWYLYSQRAVPRILEMEPEARFLVALRNPIDMGPSLHTEHLKAGVENLRDFEAAWHAQEDRRAGRHIPRLSPEPEMLQYGPVCLLGSQLQRLYSHVDREHVHTILLDDIISDETGALDRLQSFLGIRRMRTALPHKNPGRVPRSLKLRRAMRAAAWVKARTGITRSFGVFRRLATAMERPPGSSPVSAELREEMVDYFAADVALLEQLLDRPLADRWLSAE